MTIPIKLRANALGEFEDSDKIEFKHGGTNANSLLEAQQNLGITEKAEAAAVTQALSTKADLVDGIIPASQLPSFVDDVLSGTYIDNVTFNDEDGDPYTPENAKIYVDTTTNKTYRWSGSIYVELGGGGVALGETSSTAYRGDRGKEAYDHSQSQGNPHNTASSEIILDSLTLANTSEVAIGDTLSVVAGKLQAQVNLVVPATWVDINSLDSVVWATSVPNNTVNCKIEFQKRDGNIYMRGFFGSNGNLSNGSLIVLHRSASYFCDKTYVNKMGSTSTLAWLTELTVFGTNTSGLLLTAKVSVQQGDAGLAFYNSSGRHLEENVVWHIPELCIGKI